MVTTEIPIVNAKDMDAPVAQAPEQELETGTEVPEVSLDDREKALTLKENTLAAKEAFGKLNIPEVLLDLVVDVDIAKQNAVIEKLSKAWTDGMRTAVKAKVASPAPNRASVPSYKPFSEMTYAEKLSLKKTNPETYRAIARK